MNALAIVLSIVGIIFWVGIIVLFVWLSRTRNRRCGQRGEEQTSAILQEFCSKTNSYLINNIFVPLYDKTTQIDHVAISKYGVFVFETKNWNGIILGNTNDKNWTQSLNFGRTTNQHYNPIFQNQTHVSCLKRLLNQKYNVFYSCIVFVKDNAPNIPDTRVINISGLKTYLSTFSKEILTQTTIEQIYRRLLAYKVKPITTEKEHVASLQK